MIYTIATKKALKLCFDNHKNQVDKGGMPYVFHPFFFFMHMDDEDSVCVALLHDIVEDTSVTTDDLEKMGFNTNVINAIKLLTHTDLPYFDYIEKISHNKIATKVKLKDLYHNSMIERLDNPTEKDLIRREKYLKAIKILEDSCKQE